MENKRIIISTGDLSGDRILARIIQNLKPLAKSKNINLEFVGLCGPQCQMQGAKSLAQTEDVSVVGLVEVVTHLPKINSVLSLLKKQISQSDSVILVDFPDFNFQLAKMAKKLTKPVDYVVAPQVWAWRSGRIQQMKEWLRSLIVALPFERELFLDAGIPTKFLGHPLRDLLPPKNRGEARAEYKFNDSDFVFLLMPGSRRSEVKRFLGLIIDSWQEFHKQRTQVVLSPLATKKVRGLLPLAPGWSREKLFEQLPVKYHKALKDLLDSGEWVLSNDSHKSMMAADFGWITSGTATLETAYYGVPHVLFYRVSAFSAWVFKSISSYGKKDNHFIGLPNILLNDRVIPELIQENVSVDNLVHESLSILSNPTHLWWMKRNLLWIPKKLGDPGVMQRMAEQIWKTWYPESNEGLN